MARGKICTKWVIMNIRQGEKGENVRVDTDTNLFRKIP